MERRPVLLVVVFDKDFALSGSHFDVQSRAGDCETHSFLDLSSWKLASGMRHSASPLQFSVLRLKTTFLLRTLSFIACHPFCELRSQWKLYHPQSVNGCTLPHLRQFDLQNTISDSSNKTPSWATRNCSASRSPGLVSRLVWRAVLWHSNSLYLLP